MSDEPVVIALSTEKVPLLLRAAMDPTGTGDLSERDAATLARVEQNVAKILAEDAAQPPAA
jgi:hypothetical protein